MGGSDLASIYQFAQNTFADGHSVTLQEAAAVPYASMGVRVGNSNEVMIVLASDDNGQMLWTSAARIAIVTRNGRIVRTAGLGHDLGGSQDRKETSASDGTVTITWAADFPDSGLFSIPVQCVARRASDETITILGKQIHTNRIEETCTAQSRQLRWSFTNTYWTDPGSGLVWRSKQHVNPQLDAIETEVLRPAE